MTRAEARRRYALFFFFYLLMVFMNPSWRNQWTYYETLGFPYERVMHLMHLPLLVCPLLDVLVVKDPVVAAGRAMRPRAVMVATWLYIAFYAGVSSLNFRWTQCYVYPWMYDIDAMGLVVEVGSIDVALGHIVYYSTLAVPVCVVTLGCSLWLLRRGKRAEHERLQEKIQMSERAGEAMYFDRDEHIKKA